MKTKIPGFTTELTEGTEKETASQRKDKIDKNKIG